VSVFHASVAYFVEHQLKKTTNCSQFVRYSTLLQAFEEFSSIPIGGAGMWFRQYMQKKFRVTYLKVAGKPREMVLYGSVHRGLALV
jgi:hypothetical protein